MSFQLILKKEKTLSDAVLKNNLNVVYDIFRNYTSITSCIFHKIILTHIIKKIHDVELEYNFNYKNSIWKKELAIYLFYNTEFIIKKSLVNNHNNNIFNCYFLNPKITMDFINFNTDDTLLKYKIKDFEKLKHIDFKNINQENLNIMIDIANTAKSGAYHNEVIIKKCLKMDYITGYYFLNLNGYSQYYYFIHKTLEKILLKNKIKELEKKVDALEKEKIILEEHIKYMPGGDGYYEAKKDFEKLTIV